MKKKRDELSREIIEIVNRLDEDGLETLVQAARAVETKRKIEVFNRELNVVADKAARRRREASLPGYQVSIERTDDDFFVIQLDQARVFFNLQEMREITQICQTSGRTTKDPRSVAVKRLFSWFEKERGDLLADAGIDSDRNPYLAELYERVVSTYTLKE